MISFPRRRFLALLALFPVTLTGCGGRAIPKVALADVAALATDALLGTLLGPSEQRRVTMMAKPEPPLLEKEGMENVVLSTDYAGFVRVSKGSLSEKDLRLIEAEVVRASGDVLKKQDFSISALPFPPAVDAAAQKTLVATFTPATEEGGSPEDKRAGRGKTYVLIRLTVTDPRTGTALRIRDFYSGRDAENRP
ncbi:MAG: hypothetical protein H7145_08560 [Akkermansiaceae bacterium]|nr:hypothetical protein [Armatimonadota bacterium]